MCVCVCVRCWCRDDDDDDDVIALADGRLSNEDYVRWHLACVCSCFVRAVSMCVPLCDVGKEVHDDGKENMLQLM